MFLKQGFSEKQRLVTAGFLLSFFSSFGQTFLVSLYVPGIINDFGISKSLFGTIYGIVTVASAFALVYAGNLIDSWKLKKYTAVSVAIFAASCIITGLSRNIIILSAGIWGLRFAGQGLFTHIASTSVSRYFTGARGKALAVSSLGYSAGEGIFPVLAGLIIGVWGWRFSMVANGAVLGALFLPLIIFILGRGEYNSSVAAKSGKSFHRKELFRDKRFYIIAVNSFIQPFAVTGLFFYQLVLAEEKGWPIGLITSSFVLYAAARAIFSLTGGPLVDRFSAVKMLPWYLLPFALALGVLALSDSFIAAPLYLIFTGISIGLSSTVKTAVLAEVFGTENMGGIRSVYAMISVLSTAASPALFGRMLDSGSGFHGITLLSLILVAVSIVTSFFLSGAEKK